MECECWNKKKTKCSCHIHNTWLQCYWAATQFEPFGYDRNCYMNVNGMWWLKKCGKTKASLSKHLSIKIVALIEFYKIKRIYLALIRSVFFSLSHLRFNFESQWIDCFSEWLIYSFYIFTFHFLLEPFFLHIAEFLYSPMWWLWPMPKKKIPQTK